MKFKYLLVFFILGYAPLAVGQNVTCAVDAGTGGSICPGDTFQLNATVAPDSLNFRYFWSPNSMNDSSIANPIASPLATTTYTVTVTTVDSTELVVNGDFQNGFTGFTSDYRDSTSTWNEGTFAINTSPQNTHPGFFPCSDHTGNGGRMMVCNGTGTPNAVVWSQTINVTPFTEYEFSCWVANVLANAPVLPTLQFSINGQLIGPPFTSNQLQCDWGQFFTTWESDTSSSAVITIVNQTTSQNGNDFAIDDISFKALCKSIDSVTVVVYEDYDVATYGLGPDTVLCDGNPVTLETSVPGANSHVWQDASTESFYIASTGGSYYVSHLDGNGCEFSDTLNITEARSPQVNLPADTTICKDNTVTFNAYDPTATAYLWRGPSVYFLQNDPRDTTFTATFEGTYEVDITNDCGVLTQIIELKTEDCVCSPFIPNSFTPNNDGNNDQLLIYTGCDVAELKFSVFNRWGERVFYTEDVNVGWNGTINGADAPIGVYVYKFEYSAENFRGDIVPTVKYGDITLVR